MPPTTAVAVLVLAAIFLLIAFMGGHFKVFGAEISERISNKGLRWAAGFLGLGLLWTATQGLTAPSPTSPLQNPGQSVQAAAISTSQAATPEETRAASAGDVILGQWRQYVYDPGSGQWQLLGSVLVGKNALGYTMAPGEQVESPGILNSISIFDVKFDGYTWTFNSNWGQGRVGNFALRRVSDTLFEGDSSYAGQFLQRNRWVKVQ